MKINKDSNGYTIFFSVAMVLVVGSLLAFIAMQLKPIQDKNVENEKKQNILAAIGVETSLESAADEFEKYVKNGLVLNNKGEAKEEGIDKAFGVDVMKQYKEGVPADQASFPLYECEKDGQKLLVVPVVGQGLWGPIWGYLAIKEDMTTIAGATFDHKGETPGLGAEIKTTAFSDQFKDLVMSDGPMPIEVVKPGKKTGDNVVDGISGGTITSNGVAEMLVRSMNVYKEYFQSHQQ
jgi:Na+-transporting NADH:ubiquinone oxidoreductase subunit C